LEQKSFQSAAKTGRKEESEKSVRSLARAIIIFAAEAAFSIIGAPNHLSRVQQQQAAE